MSQNKSHAVMAQRHEPHDSLDFFPTPPWATRALCEWLNQSTFPSTAKQSVWEPACGDGAMGKPLGEYFHHVYASDVAKYGHGRQQDFLLPNFGMDVNSFDWIITNPPFRLGERFALTALARAKRGVALLVRTAFLESTSRFAGLYAVSPPTDILQFVERVPMFKGRLDREGSTATSYCWLIWRKHQPLKTNFHWIAPCRKRLERDSDYT